MSYVIILWLNSDVHTDIDKTRSRTCNIFTQKLETHKLSTILLLCDRFVLFAVFPDFKTYTNVEKGQLFRPKYLNFLV